MKREVATVRDINFDLGQNIRRERIRLGINQVTLGDILGRTGASISQMENGKISITFYDLYVMSKYLNVKIYDFLRGIE